MTLVTQVTLDTNSFTECVNIFHLRLAHIEKAVDQPEVLCTVSTALAHYPSGIGTNVLAILARGCKCRLIIIIIKPKLKLWKDEIGQ